MEYVSFIIPVLIIPFFMRFIISPVILSLLKRRYLRIFIEKIKNTQNEKDRKAVEKLISLTWKNLNNPFVLSYNINKIRRDALMIIFNIAEIYGIKNTLSFSVQKITETVLLAFEDIYQTLSNTRLYTLIQRIPVKYILKTFKIQTSFKPVSNHKVFRFLSKYRLTGKILRIILIPILGLPYLIYQLIVSLFYSTILEGYLRFLYGTALLKLGYYAIYLYSDTSGSINQQLCFSKESVISQGKRINELYLNLESREEKSPLLSEALTIIKDVLCKQTILPLSPLYRQEGREKKRIKAAVRAKVLLKRTVEYNWPGQKRNPVWENILEIYTALGKHYKPGSREPLWELRLKDIIEAGYFSTTYILSVIYTLPVSRSLLNTMSVKWAFRTHKTLKKTGLRRFLPFIKEGGRLAETGTQLWRVMKTVSGKSSPVVLGISLLYPLIFQESQNLPRDFLLNKISLLILDCFEASELKNSDDRIAYVFDVSGNINQT